MRHERLTVCARETARRLFAMMADVFGEGSSPLSDAYLDQLLQSESFWTIAAMDDGAPVGGITAHALPMTRSESAELFIYDVAVRAEYQRQGVGRGLIGSLRQHAAGVGIHVLFVPADNDDVHALDFYRALGAEAAPVTFFTFRGSGHS